jgi:hypothetical protein
VPDVLPTSRPVATTAYSPEPPRETSPETKRERSAPRSPQVATAPLPNAKPAAPAAPQPASKPSEQAAAPAEPPPAPKPAQVARKKQDSGWSFNPLPFLVRHGIRPNEPAKPSR